jgi:hypothetical protein
MAKMATDATIDGGLNYIAGNAKKIFVCTTAAISTYADAASNYNLTSGVAVTSTHFVIGDGDASGRKIAVQAQSSLSVSTSGTAGHVAVTSSDTLILATTCTTQALTSGNTVTVPTWDIEIADPT